MTALLVVLGGALGATTRYAVTRAMHARWALPWGTVVVNAVGSYLLGGVLAWAGPDPGRAPVVALVGTGFCGALSTFSTLAWEVHVLARAGRRLAATTHLLGSLAVGLPAVWLGLLSGVSLTGGAG